MSDNDQHSGIFDGTDAMIASFFGLRDDQHLKQRSVSRGLDDPGNVDGGFLALVSSLYGRIESNHTSRLPSRENWRSKRVTTLSDHNESPEVLLERAVAMLGEAGTAESAGLGPQFPKPRPIERRTARSLYAPGTSVPPKRC